MPRPLPAGFRFRDVRDKDDVADRLAAWFDKLDNRVPQPEARKLADALAAEVDFRAAFGVGDPVQAVFAGRPPYDALSTLRRLDIDDHLTFGVRLYYYEDPSLGHVVQATERDAAEWFARPDVEPCPYPADESSPAGPWFHAVSGAWESVGRWHVPMPPLRHLITLQPSLSLRLRRMSEETHRRRHYAENGVTEPTEEAEKAFQRWYRTSEGRASKRAEIARLKAVLPARITKAIATGAGKHEPSGAAVSDRAEI